LHCTSYIYRCYPLCIRFGRNFKKYFYSDNFVSHWHAIFNYLVFIKIQNATSIILTSKFEPSMNENLRLVSLLSTLWSNTDYYFGMNVYENILPFIHFFIFYLYTHFACKHRWIGIHVWYDIYWIKWIKKKIFCGRCTIAKDTIILLKLFAVFAIICGIWHWQEDIKGHQLLCTILLSS
jgi:hypothetical protein